MQNAPRTRSSSTRFLLLSMNLGRITRMNPNGETPWPIAHSLLLGKNRPLLVGTVKAIERHRICPSTRLHRTKCSHNHPVLLAPLILSQQATYAPIGRRKLVARSKNPYRQRNLKEITSSPQLEAFGDWTRTPLPSTLTCTWRQSQLPYYMRPTKVTRRKLLANRIASQHVIYRSWKKKRKKLTVRRPIALAHRSLPIVMEKPFTLEADLGQAPITHRKSLHTAR